MKVKQWVDMGTEVEVEIGVDDIRAALSESFAVVTEDRLGGPGPNRAEIAMAFNSIGAFLKAVTDAHIGMLTFGQLQTIHNFLSTQAARFKVTEENGCTYVGKAVKDQAVESGA